MPDYDDLLREKEANDDANDSAMETNWAALEKQMDTATNPAFKSYRRVLQTALAVAAVLVVVLFSYTLLSKKEKQQGKSMAITNAISAVQPPLEGANVPYESFHFDAATGDTLFTLNGSILVFPAHSVLNRKGEIVTGNIEVRTREFNDPFDYSIAGIPMNYDSAGTNYSFISSGMIDVCAYQGNELLQVNPAAKPQLNLVSTNKELNTSLYLLDTLSGKWLFKGRDEVNLVAASVEARDAEPKQQNGDSSFAVELTAIPVPPEKASGRNTIIDVVVDPESFKELLVYDGLKFEVTDAGGTTVEEGSKIAWDDIELINGEVPGTYKVVFSAGTRKAMYHVKPVLVGADFEAAEKLYQQKLKEYAFTKNKRKKNEQALKKENKRMEELNKLIARRNKFIEAENMKIEALNNEMRRKFDSIDTYEQQRRIAALEKNLVRSFIIDGFGFWNCDQPTLPQCQMYVGHFRLENGAEPAFNVIYIAMESVNRVQNYPANNIGLIPGASHFGWAFNKSQVYYFTRENFKSASVRNNPKSVSLTMNRYTGEVSNYRELKEYIYYGQNAPGGSKKPKS